MDGNQTPSRDFGDVWASLPVAGVARLTLNRPEVLNAVRETTFLGLRDGARWLSENPDCGVIVLQSTGRSFCAGLDLKGGLTGAEEGDRTALNQRAISAGAEAVATLRELPQPVIAAVRGAAVGAGFSIATAADVRVCSPDARFDAPFVHVGMSVGDLGLSWLLPRLIGSAPASRLLLGAGTLPAVDAKALGFVSEIDEDPEGRAMEMAREMAARPRLATSLSKALLHSAQSSGFREHLAAEVTAQVACSLTREHRDAVAAFTTRRPGPRSKRERRED